MFKYDKVHSHSHMIHVYSTVQSETYLYKCTMINHCDRRITHLGDLDRSCVNENELYRP